MTIQLRDYQTQLITNIRLWNGKAMYPKEWAAEFGISVQRFYGRRRAGWSMDRIASTPVRKWSKQ